MIERLLLHAAQADFTTEFHQPLNLRGGNFGMTLKRITLWNSWHNISQKYKNNTFDYYNGQEYVAMTIPDGNYTVRTLNDYFQIANVDVKITINEALSSFDLHVGKEKTFDISKGKLCEILGFEPGIYSDTFTGQHKGNISRGVDIFLVHCDLISSSRYDDGHSDILHRFTPRARPGSLIDINITEPIYIPIMNTSEIRRIRLWLTDQDYKPVELNNHMVFYEILFRPI